MSTAPFDYVLLMLGTGVLGVVVFRYLRLPSILGYLAVGIFIGPHSWGLVNEAEWITELGEFGVVFLMFTVGLEFSLPQLISMRKIVFGLGLSQVTVSIIGSIFIHLILIFILPSIGVSWQAALAIGGAWAMSSTAIVTKMLAERNELESDYGRSVIGVLLFQDLAIVFLMILVPTLSRGTNDLMVILGLSAGKIAVVLGVLFLLGKRVMNRWIAFVARLHSQELFMLNLLMLTLGAAWITDKVGLSMELGAFIAGMLIAETRFKHEVEDNIQSFRDVLLGLFFITIGMRLDMRLVLQYWWLVLLFVIFFFFYKFFVTKYLSQFFGATKGVSMKTGLALAQAGEFSFVLVNQIADLQLMEKWLLQVILTSMVISMLIAPFIILKIDEIAKKFVIDDKDKQALELKNLAQESEHLEGHVILAGFGRTGQSIASILDEESIPYKALDLDLDRIKQAEAAGNAVAYADSTKRESLEAVGLRRAAALIITFSNLNAVLRILYFAKDIAPQVPVIVRSYDGNDYEILKAAGADEVVQEVIESSMIMASSALLSCGISMPRVLRLVQAIRMSRYEKLRDYFHGESDKMPTYMDTYWRKQTFKIPADAKVVGKQLPEINLSGDNIEIIQIRRAKKALVPSADYVIRPGDVFVLRGNAQGIREAEEAFYM